MWFTEDVAVMTVEKILRALLAFAQAGLRIRTDRNAARRRKRLVFWALWPKQILIYDWRLMIFDLRRYLLAISKKDLLEANESFHWFRVRLASTKSVDLTGMSAERPAAKEGHFGGALFFWLPFLLCKQKKSDNRVRSTRIDQVTFDNFI
ncbi:MAG TPA: hypothetical protein VD927_08210 [Chryseosolibacter sp.]|nr:hypothetical protein [Chryseosolibacter sp.]